MNANRTFTPNATGAATGSAEVTGAIPPGLTLLGFRDGWRQPFRDESQDPKQTPAKPEVKSEHAHAAFAGLFALGTIAMLALGRQDYSPKES